MSSNLIWSLKCFSIKADEKPSEEEQGEKLEGDLAGVALQAEEEDPSDTPTENTQPPQNQQNLEKDNSTEKQPTASQSNITRSVSSRGRLSKSAPLSGQKKISVKSEEEGAVKVASGFQDDPSDADYTPSKYWFTECLM